MLRDPTSMIMDASALGWVAFPLYGTRLDFFFFSFYHLRMVSLGKGEAITDGKKRGVRYDTP